MSTMSLNDVLAHEAGSHVRVSPEIRKAVTRYGICSATIDRLSALDAHFMTPAQFDLLFDAQTERAALHAQLTKAGQLHLVERA